jgi:hypothetical protein
MQDFEWYISLLLIVRIVSSSNYASGKGLRAISAYPSRLSRLIDDMFNSGIGSRGEITLPDLLLWKVNDSTTSSPPGARTWWSR